MTDSRNESGFHNVLDEVEGGHLTQELGRRLPEDFITPAEWASRDRDLQILANTHRSMAQHLGQAFGPHNVLIDTGAEDVWGDEQ